VTGYLCRKIHYIYIERGGKLLLVEVSGLYINKKHMLMEHIIFGEREN
jgi:hypothetical protein